MLKKKYQKIIVIFMVCIMAFAITTLASADSKGDNVTVFEGKVKSQNPDGINVYEEIYRDGSAIIKTETVYLDCTAYDGPEEFRAALENSNLNCDITEEDIKESMPSRNNDASVSINTILNLALFNFK